MVSDGERWRRYSEGLAGSAGTRQSYGALKLTVSSRLVLTMRSGLSRDSGEAGASSVQQDRGSNLARQRR